MVAYDVCVKPLLSCFLPCVELKAIEALEARNNNCLQLAGVDSCAGTVIAFDACPPRDM